MLLRFVHDDTGQDLIEYALLSSFIGLCALLAWLNIPPAIASAYGRWDTGVQTLGSCTQNPGGGGCSYP
jgi:Flp pilus assembly pilin Flp